MVKSYCNFHRASGGKNACLESGLPTPSVSETSLRTSQHKHTLCQRRSVKVITVAWTPGAWKCWHRSLHLPFFSPYMEELAPDNQPQPSDNDTSASPTPAPSPGLISLRSESPVEDVRRGRPTSSRTHTEPFGIQVEQYGQAGHFPVAPVAFPPYMWIKFWLLKGIRG